MWQGSLHAKSASAKPTVIDGARPSTQPPGSPPHHSRHTRALSRAFRDKGPSLPATRGNLTIVVGVDKQKTVSYRGIVHILRPWWKMYYLEIV